MKLKTGELKPETFKEKYRRVIGRDYVSDDEKRRSQNEGLLKALIENISSLWIPYRGEDEDKEVQELKNKILERMR